MCARTNRLNSFLIARLLHLEQRVLLLAQLCLEIGELILLLAHKLGSLNARHRVNVGTLKSRFR